MSLLFPSEAWVLALKDALNQHAGYQEAAKKWEGDLSFVIEPGPGLDAPKYLYLDLWHGECRGAAELPDLTETVPEFSIAAPLQTWRQVIEGKVDPIRGLMTRKLKLTGPMTKIMKTPKAALELVNCAKELDTTWPG